MTVERQESGVASDPESVRRAIENSRREDYRLPGLFYTPEELADSEATDHTLPDIAERILEDAGADLGPMS